MNITADIPADQKAMLFDFLVTNSYIFTWFAIDISGVNPKIVMHSLDVDDRPGVFQKKRVLGLER